LREHIGDISSQEDVFKGTLLENITIGRKVQLHEVLDICEEAGLSEFIRQLPEGLNTSLLPGGKNIPRSIITKILVTRALVGRPKLLVLEEPLGNLNYRDRLRIAQMLTDKSRSWTMVAVSEDPILASMADRVWVMREGALVFDGTFDEVQKTEHFNRIFRTGGEGSSWFENES
jgi:ABC-type multidrug transport system fused ATPase/permease subunit